jgi:hypothetical protein
MAEFARPRVIGFNHVEHLSCVAAVSVNFLHGLYAPERLFEPLRRREPLARVGNSIYVYDLRR